MKQFIGYVIRTILVLNLIALSISAVPETVMANDIPADSECTNNIFDVRDHCMTGLVCLSSGGVQSFCKIAPELDVSCQAFPNPAVKNTTVEWRYIHNPAAVWNRPTATWTWEFDDGTTQVASEPNTFARKAYGNEGTYTARVTLSTDTPQQDTSPDCSVSIIAAAPTVTSPGGATPTPGGTLGTSTTGICGIGEPDVATFISKLFGCGIGLVGGVALLAIIYGGFIFVTSGGDPNRVRIGKEYITYAIVGLLLAIFSILILEVVGVDLLRIPGFTQ